MPRARIDRAERARLQRRIYNALLEHARQLPDRTDPSGLDQEIALLRTMLAELATKRPADYKTTLRAAEALAKLVATQHRLSPASRDNLAAAIAGVLEGVGHQLGIGELTP